MSQNTTKKSSKNILVRNMNAINFNEIILVLNPNSQGGDTGKTGLRHITKLRIFYPKITKLFLLKNE